MSAALLIDRQPDPVVGLEPAASDGELGGSRASTSAPELPRLLAGIESGRSISLADHRRVYPMPPHSRSSRPGEDLLAAVERSGLRGRGGAGFPTGRKLRAVSRGRRPVVVVNGAEGEPASGKDRVLLARAPHLVLDGALLAAAAIGAETVVVCVDRQATVALAALKRAVAERRGAEGIGNVQVAAVPAHYVAGEATALVHWLNGGEAKPTGVSAAVEGVGGRPTLVDNVETIAHLAQIVRWGSAWFREKGTPEEPGTMLVTVSGAVRRPGVYEAPFGSRLAKVIMRAGGTPTRMSAVLVGGYYGSWLSAGDARRVRLCNEDLRLLGAGVGCGAIVVLPPDVCGLKETARILTWLAGESAGQCGSCVHGLAAIAGATTDLHDGDDTVARLRRWADMVEGRGGCRFPDGAVQLLRSALDVFQDEIESHLCRGGCRGSRTLLPTPDTKGQPWR